VVCSENRGARLMRAAVIKSVRGYKRPRYKAGRPSLVAPIQLQRQFQHNETDLAWVTDITYIKTYEGWLYLAAVLDLHSRAVVGWSMGSQMQTRLVLDALTMAVWQTKGPRALWRSIRNRAANLAAMSSIVGAKTSG